MAHSLPWLLSRQVFAADAVADRTLVVIFQRGAMDGLSMVPPLVDPFYSTARPNIAITSKNELPPIRLDGNFGLHPALGPLKSIWDEGTLAFVHQAGSADSTRSHFDAQDFMESGTPGDKNTEDGFLNRSMRIIPGQSGSRLRAIALQPNMPRILAGSFPAISMNALSEFDIKSPITKPGDVAGFETMYQGAADRVFRGVGDDAFQAVKMLKPARESESSDAANLVPKTPLAKRLRDISILIKAGVGLQVAVTDIGGWDTHVNQGNHKGQLANRFTELADALAAFRKDLGQAYSRVCVVVFTEFGRTVKENGNRGTDHGHGSVMTLFGGSVAGRKIYGNWKDLSPSNLFEGRDVPMTTDFRAVFVEVLRKHLGVKDFSKVFPGFGDPKELGILRG